MKREFECNMDRSYEHKTDRDEWGCAFIWDENEKIGAEYNFCIEEGYNSCAIYTMREDGQYMSTDYSDYEHYEIEWEFIDWKDRLERAMNRFMDKREERRK